MKTLIYAAMLISLLVLFFWGLIPWLIVMGILVFISLQVGKETG